MRKKVLSRAWLAACLLGASLFAGQTIFRSTKEPAHTSAQATRSQVSKTIETIRVGQRVLTSAQDAEDGSSRRSSVNVHSWRQLRLQAENPWADGRLDVIEVETLQSPAWVEEHRAERGALVPLPLDLQEMGLPSDLKAKVVANEPCPALEQGPGRLVLTTVNHLNNDVYEIGVSGATGGSETIRPTGLHKFYSVTRGGWVSAKDLEAGEELKGVRGPVYVDTIRALPGIQRVYNMTVEGEHVYRVSSAGVLVHNNGCANTVIESPTGPSSPGSFSFNSISQASIPSLPQVTINQLYGSGFQGLVTTALGANPSRPMTGTTLSGRPYTTNPDGGMVPDGALLEVKGGGYISNRPQLQAQTSIGQAPGGPGNVLVVRPGAALSRPVINAYSGPNAMIVTFDPLTGSFAPYSGPIGPVP